MSLYNPFFRIPCSEIIPVSLSLTRQLLALNSNMILLSSVRLEILNKFLVIWVIHDFCLNTNIYQKNIKGKETKAIPISYLKLLLPSIMHLVAQLICI